MTDFYEIGARLCYVAAGVGVIAIIYIAARIALNHGGTEPLPPRQPRPRCALCTHASINTAQHETWGVIRVCQGCLDKGMVLGWWIGEPERWWAS